MARRITQVFHGGDQRDVIVTLPADHGRASEHCGLLRAWAVDDETGEWWGMCSYYVGTGVQMLGWVNQGHLRPVVELTDQDGLVDPGKVIALPRARAKNHLASAADERALVRPSSSAE